MTDDAMTWEGLCPLGPECPFPSDPDWHIPHCGHGLEGHHHHWPPKSRGGKRIVTFICPDCHRKVGEGRYGNAVKQADDGTEHYVLWAKKGGKVFVDRVIGRWKEEEQLKRNAGETEGGGRHLPDESGEALVLTPNDPLARAWDNPEDAEAFGDETLPTVKEEDQPPDSLLSITDIFKSLHMKPHPTGLAFADEQTEEEWAFGGKFLGFLGSWLPWAVGDWLKQGQWKWGEKYAQAASETGLKEERLQQYQWVAEAVENCTRVQELSWSHHREVADKQPEEQREWLQRAQDEGMTANELRLAIKGPQPPDVCPGAPDGEHDWQRVCRHCGKAKP